MYENIEFTMTGKYKKGVSKCILKSLVKVKQTSL